METEQTNQEEKRKKNKKAVVEAALFMANEPIKSEKISRLTRVRVNDVIEIVNEMKEKYNSEDHGIHVFETNAGLQIKVKPEYVSYVRSLAPYQDLSKGILRVLALVAYKQPITQSEIVKVIGNRTYEYVKQLVERGFIRTIKTGRTKALVATKEFAEYFGLESPEDIKKFFNEMIQEVPKKEDSNGEDNEGNERS